MECPFRTATMQEIKVAYRKMAMSFHPDRNKGNSTKADTFKSATEAYRILSDHQKRTEYDKMSHGYRDPTTSKRRYAPPPNYRKVYSPRAPPGFKTFDNKRHFDMHYGDGEMKAEIDRAQKRVLQAGQKNQYQSPLGPGFTFDHLDQTGSGNFFAATGSQDQSNSSGSAKGTNAHREDVFFGGEFAGRQGGEINSIRYYHKVQVRDKMEERRQSRPSQGERDKLKQGIDLSGCIIS